MTSALPWTGALPLVMAGGAMGAGLRYLVGRYALSHWGSGWPYGTLAVNIFGGLAMGLLMGWIARHHPATDAARLLLGVGVLGGFTTFSAFSFEVMTMVQRNALGQAAGYALASVVGSVLALWLGLLLTRGSV